MNERSKQGKASSSSIVEGAVYVHPKLEGDDGEVIGYSVQTIDVDPESLYQLWSQMELIPRWQEHVVSVTRTGDLTSHWIMGDPEDPDGKRVEFESEVVESIPGRKISWRSITENVEHAGYVTFEKTSRGTRVTLQHSAKVPGGSLGSAISAVIKRSPRQTIIEDLRHFKEFAETGEIPTVKGQPHGERGLSGGIKAWMYGETNPTPPGSSEA